MKISRAWAMPNPNTFSIPPIADFVSRWLAERSCIIDPFARDSSLTRWSNDLNPETSATYHLPAEDFLALMVDTLGPGSADAILIDPPYSPRQISECYNRVGLPCSTKDTQNAALMKRVKDAAAVLLAPTGVVLSFGWNSGGMGKSRGFRIEEILLVAHGGAHNDTICVADRRC